jgi:hypothetical protein
MRSGPKPDGVKNIDFPQRVQAFWNFTDCRVLPLEIFLNSRRGWR